MPICPIPICGTDGSRSSTSHWRSVANSGSTAFVADRCEIGTEEQHAASIKHLFDEWQNWCTEKGERKFGTSAVFCKNLVAAFPFLTRTRSRDGEKRVPRYDGIRLLSVFEQVE